jgi:ribonuclease PH
MKRPDDRRAGELRPVRIHRGYTDSAPGSVLIEVGRTRVLCTVCFVPGVPPWRVGSGLGWLTAEYDMLPASTGERRARARLGRIDGRTQEIQRLIGRCLRAVADLSQLGENSFWVDCDVLQADGGTRTASITGAYVALCDAVQQCLQSGRILGDPIQGAVAAVSVGMLDGQRVLDLSYEEDYRAQVDFNVAMTDTGRFVEVQGTAEHACFTSQDMDEMIKLARRGIRRLLVHQHEALGKRPSRRRSGG